MLQSLRSRSDAREWAEGIIDQVATQKAWPDSFRDLAAQAIGEAWDATPYVTSPFWGVLSDTGPEFFTALSSVWTTHSTFPESWNKLAAVWVEAEGTAKAQDAQSSAAWSGLVEAMNQTGADLKTVAKVGIGSATTILFVGAILYGIAVLS